MGHAGCRRCAVPVLDTGRNPDHVTGPYLLDQASPMLHHAHAGRDDQRLAKRMRMPGRARAGFEGNAGTADARWRAALEPGIDTDVPGEVTGGTSRRGLRPDTRDGYPLFSLR
ncbi:hypothetical protein D3C72_1698220 [compost metagenome]